MTLSVTLCKGSAAREGLSSLPQKSLQNCISANENIVVYLRKTKKAEETLLIVVNFENVPRKNYKIGVPFEGKYKEIFNVAREKHQ